MNLDILADDPLAFFDALIVPTAHGPQLFASCMADFQHRFFQAIAPSLVAVANGEQPPIPRYYLARTKGAAKDSDIACCLLWLLAFSPRPLRIQIAANDQEQADEIRLIVREKLRLDGWLNEILCSLLEVRSSEIINPNNGAIAQILTRDAKGGHGSRPDLVVVNECTHIQDEEFASTCFDNLDKMPNGVGIIATNAGFVGTWQDRWREIAFNSPRWWTQNITHPAPWISEDDLAESRKRNSAARYNRLWRGQWVSAAGDALDADAIRAAIKLTGPVPPRTPGMAFIAGVDLGLTRDASAIVVLAKSVGHWEDQSPGETPQKSFLAEVLADLRSSDLPQEPEQTAIFVPGDGIARLAMVKVFDPRVRKFTLADVEAEIIALNSLFGGMAAVAIDEYQALRMCETLRAAGLPAVGIPATGPNLRITAQTVLDSFAERTIQLFNDETLLADLAALRVTEKSYGIRLESSRGEGATNHADSASAFALALQAARRIDPARTTARIPGELVCWP